MRNGKPKKPLVFDAWALMADLQQEPSASKIDALVEAAIELSIPILVTTINLGEVWYNLARRYSATDADLHVKRIRQSGIETIDVDWDLVQQAAYYKSCHRMSYADGFAAALAKRLDAELVTGDGDFKPLESEIQIHWV